MALTIRSYAKRKKIMKKPTTRDIRLVAESILEEQDLQDAISSITVMIDEAYDAGHQEGIVQGALEYESDNHPINEEKSNTEYVVEKFSDCHSFDDFLSVFNEIRNRSYNFM